MKKLIACTFVIGIKSVFKKHTYQFRGKYYLQGDRGPTGLQATQAVARICMIWFDRKFLQRLAMLGIIIIMYLRYVDDVDVIVKELEDENVEYNDVDKKLVKVEEKAEESKEKKTMEILKSVANSVSSMIKWEIDIAEIHVSKKLPVLDLNIYKKEDKEGNEQIVHEFY